MAEIRDATESLNQIVKYLELQKNDFKTDTLYRLYKGFVLEFRSGTSLFGTQYKVFTNHPLEDGNGFRRAEFHALEWQRSSESADETAFFARITMLIAGSFEYYYEDEETNERLGHGYFVVNPELKIAKGSSGSPEVLPLDSVVLQTVITKLLGPLTEWDSRLRVARETGYNMIHFTPIQELGSSNSAYALADQLKVSSTIANSLEEVGQYIKSLYENYNMLSMIDIVLNHTATSSPWLIKHPEAVYNMENSPHLRSAFLLDYLIKELSDEIAAGKYTSVELPPNITAGSQLDKIKQLLWDKKIFPAKLHEYHLADTAKVVEEFKKTIKEYKPIDKKYEGLRELELQPGNSTRFGAGVDFDAARAFFHAPTSVDPNDPNNWKVDDCANKLKSWLDRENGKKYEAVQSHLGAALNCIAAGVHYERLEHGGPRYGAITKEHPLISGFFHTVEEFSSLQEAEAAAVDPARGRLIMAYNGWVMNFDPLKNFAAADCNVYLRRELIPWVDNVKLRFGEGPDDCPYLWSRMRDYVVQMSSIFHGVRLDNAHSTPIHVAEYMLDAGRAVNPDLYVVAELFTGSEGHDNVFVNRLGITSLIREAQNANDSHDLGRLVHRFGGDPVGSLSYLKVDRLRPCVAHALFYDQTHDNPSHIQKRSLADVLPTAACISMAFAASGSTRGYDELVPYAVDVVKEKRLYRKYAEKVGNGDVDDVDLRTGILRSKLELNKIPHLLASGGFSEIFVDQMDPSTIAITRHNPNDHSSYICVLRNAFQKPDVEAFKHAPYLRALEVEGVLEEIVLEAFLDIKGEPDFKESQVNITGYANMLELYSAVNVKFEQSRLLSINEETRKASNKRQINFKYFPPGAVILFRTSVGEKPAAALRKIHELTDTPSLEKLSDLCKGLSLADFNRILFRTAGEENDDGSNGGTYSIPKFGDLPYCGLQSFHTMVEKVRKINDLGHPFCENLRNGNWMMEYIANRLRHHSSTLPLADWLDAIFSEVKTMPRYLVPQYFSTVVTKAYDVIVKVALDRFGPHIANGSAFTKMLALGTYQMCGVVLSSKMPPLSPGLTPQPPKIKLVGKEGEVDGAVSMAAGLPHFTTGWSRNWGRDTFIALRGLLLLTGQFQEARQIILAFAGCLRHGLIPNLLMEGTGSRFNARDAVWFWLYSIQSYVSMAPDGQNILKDQVSRMFLHDDDPPAEPGTHNQPLHDVMQEALTKHIQGQKFRERNAGWNLDQNMDNEGFNNGIGIDLSTGFVFGGNPHNCGTWMDKMGSSEKAGTKGKPATPRDGSAIELVALCKATVAWLKDMNDKKAYPYSGITWKNLKGQDKTISFGDWNKLIQDNFEQRFLVSQKSLPEFIRRDFVQAQPIYKDTYGSFHFWADYQLRPNICVAMVVAPEMFDAKNAWDVLEVIQSRLVGPLGMKTLDPHDWAYEGNYDNGDQSDNPKIAHGFNYHQGPEWVWPMGYFLRAKLIFAQKQQDSQVLKTAVRYVRSVLARHWAYIQESDWRGLPELTNANGAYCKDSCETQAWSLATVLEAVHSLQELSN